MIAQIKSQSAKSNHQRQSAVLTMALAPLIKKSELMINRIEMIAQIKSQSAKSNHQRQSVVLTMALAS